MQAHQASGGAYKRHPAVHLLKKVAVGLVLTGVATAATLALWPHTGKAPFLIFHLAILMACIYGGTQAGLTAVSLSLAAVHHFFLRPLHDGSWAMGDLVLLGLSGLVGGLMVFLTGRWRHHLVAFTTRDIGQRLAHEGEVDRLNRLYEALTEVNQAVTRSGDRNELFKAVCEALVRRGGFSVAWIRWHDPLQQRLLPVAQCGRDEEELRRMVVSTADGGHGQGPSDTAFRSGQPCICNDFRHPQAIPGQIGSSAALPIALDGETCGVLSVYAADRHYFQDKELALIQEVAADLSFALGMLSRENRRQQAEASARREQMFSDAMIDSMPGIVYCYDEQGRFLRWNQNFTRVSGYDATEISTMHPLDFFTGQDKQRLAEKIAEVYEEGESFVEATFVSKDGRTTPYFFTGRRVMLDDVPCLIGVGMDITARHKAQQSLQDYARRLQATSRRLLEVQETERRMLARDLHDSVGQELTALSLNLSIIGSLLPAELAPSILSRLDDSQKLLETTTQHLRHVMVELRPPGLDDLGLLAAIKDHAQRVAARSGFSLCLSGKEPRPRLSDTVEIALFRIVQEALNNTVKHAQATEIGIALAQDAAQVSLVVDDNGRGFATTQVPGDTSHRMGMTTMRERAEAIGASLEVDSVPGGGTRITVKLAHPTPPFATSRTH